MFTIGGLIVGAIIGCILEVAIVDIGGSISMFGLPCVVFGCIALITTPFTCGFTMLLYILFLIVWTPFILFVMLVGIVVYGIVGLLGGGFYGVIPGIIIDVIISPCYCIILALVIVGYVGVEIVTFVESVVLVTSPIEESAVTTERSQALPEPAHAGVSNLILPAAGISAVLALIYLLK